MVLFKPKWMSGNETKALAAVNRLEDEAMLCRAALACVHPRVEQAAISRIQKDKLLLQIVLSEKLSPQNRIAAWKISLHHVPKHDSRQSSAGCMCPAQRQERL